MLMLMLIRCFVLLHDYSVEFVSAVEISIHIYTYDINIISHNLLTRCSFAINFAMKEFHFMWLHFTCAIYICVCVSVSVSVFVCFSSVLSNLPAAAAELIVGHHCLIYSIVPMYRMALHLGIHFARWAWPEILGVARAVVVNDADCMVVVDLIAIFEHYVNFDWNYCGSRQMKSYSFCWIH